MIGKSLSHYKIHEKIGSGGMGEVYLAEDTTLGRNVALKILPPEMASHPERRNRFEREARAVAALNHPNIVTVYSVEQAEGVHFITMELVRGKTLTELIPKNGIPLNKLCEIAIPLSDAVSAAHQQGITHRDLKPDNLMVSDEGRLKILDFGLAKLRQESTASVISQLPTQSGTREGQILGTVAYMSPEQAEGKPIDHRSDIFSMGIILYEMATGVRPFTGDTTASVFSSIIKDTPASVTEINPTLPRDLGRIIRRCLIKDPERRYQTAKDLRNELEELKREVESGEAFAGATASVPRRRDEGWRRTVLWGLAGLMAVLAVTFAVLYYARRPTPHPIRRFVIQPPATAPLVGRSSLTVSPDGTRLVYRSRVEGKTQLFVRRLDQLEANPLPGIEGVYPPIFFSPDGQWIGFQTEGKLKKVALSGGAPVTLCETPTIGLLGASWGHDGTILFGGMNIGVWRVSAEGGEPEALTTPDVEKGELDCHSPEILPGGKAALFSLHLRTGGFRIEVLSLVTGERKVLIEKAFHGRYVPTGHIIYGRGNTLFAAPFDLESLEVTGPSVRVLENVDNLTEDGHGAFSVGADGTLAYIPERSHQGRKLVWVNRDGSEEPLPVEPDVFSSPRLSPDGDRVAAAVRDGDRQDIWVYDLERDTRVRVTFEGWNETPVWTPDGKGIAFSSNRTGFRDIYWKPAGGAGTAEILLESELWMWPGSWSPDGGTLAFTETDPTERGDIGTLSIHDGGQPQPFIKSPASNWDPRFSPDGRWMAYESNGEIFVTPLSGAGGARQISTDGGYYAVWGPEGRELFYRNGNKIIAVPIETTAIFDTGKPSILFERRYVWDLWGFSYDVAPDGRFLMIKPSQEELAPRAIHVVLDWFEELKRRVPVN